MKTKKMLFIGLFVLVGNILMAQSACYDKPIPKMNVLNALASTRFTEFQNKRKGLQTTPNVSYPVDKFIALLKLMTTNANCNGLRVYIGATKNTANFDKTITFIYVATHQVGQVKYQDYTEYYSWVDASGDFKNIGKDEAKKQVDNYNSSDLKNILNGIKYGGLLGGIFGKKLDGGDTKCMLYKSICNINELQEEFLCQSVDHKITDITIDFSSYSTEEPIKDYHNRLIFHFKMLRYGQPYTLETDDPYFTHRLTNPSSCPNLTGPEGGFDTGDPCPPGGNCEGESL